MELDRKARWVPIEKVNGESRQPVVPAIVEAALLLPTIG
jgi:hypothetical protein